jgi:hypothetical protein
LDRGVGLFGFFKRRCERERAQIDASSMPAMQAEMLEALKRHGLAFGGADVRFPPSDPCD